MKNREPMGSTRLEKAIRTGTFLLELNPGVTVGAEFLTGLFDALVAPEEALYHVGLGWGRTLAGRIRLEAEEIGANVSSLGPDDVLLLLEDTLTQGRWGRVKVTPLDGPESGLLLAAVYGGPLQALDPQVGQAVASLLAGFLSGALEGILELPMAGIGCRLDSDDLTYAELVIGHEVRVERIRQRLGEGMGWHAALGNGAASSFQT